MTALANVVIGKSSVPSLTITVILLLTIPVVFCICWRVRHREQTNIAYLIAGTAGFIVSARVLELGVHYFCVLAENPVSRFIGANTAAYVLYGTVMAGVFEECGRHVVLKRVLKKNRTRENAVFYGIGHGGIEILAVMLPAMVTYLAVAILFSKGNAAEAMDALKITEETAGSVLASVQAAAAFDWAAMAMNVLERLLTMFVHVGLTVIVFYGVHNRKKGCLPSAILLHMLVDTFPALYQRGAIPLWTVELWVALWAAVIVFIACRLYKNLKEQPASL